MRIHPDTIAEAGEAAQDAVRDYVSSGEVTEDEALELLIALLDAALPMRALIPGLGGQVAEVATDKVLKKAIPKLVKLLKPDAERLLKRADRASARGRFKRAAMLRQRAKAVKAAKAKK